MFIQLNYNINRMRSLYIIIIIVETEDLEN